MRTMKKMVILFVILWVLVLFLGNNVASMSDVIWKIMNAFMPVAIVLIGIGLMIKSIFK